MILASRKTLPGLTSAPKNLSWNKPTQSNVCSRKVSQFFKIFKFLYRCSSRVITQKSDKIETRHLNRRRAGLRSNLATFRPEVLAVKDVLWLYTASVIWIFNEKIWGVSHSRPTSNNRAWARSLTTDHRVKHDFVTTSKPKKRLTLILTAGG